MCGEGWSQKSCQSDVHQNGFFFFLGNLPPRKVIHFPEYLKNVCVLTNVRNVRPVSHRGVILRFEPTPTRKGAHITHDKRALPSLSHTHTQLHAEPGLRARKRTESMLSVFPSRKGRLAVNYPFPDNRSGTVSAIMA